MNINPEKFDFYVDTQQLSQKRKDRGVSGMMRVRNDAEFLHLCVDSCIEALDELVIVYNNCSDASPEIIEALAKKYPSKIKAYHYLPKILAWNLTEKTANDIMCGIVDPVNTLAGYYNYALSKTTYRFVLKIDADQIYNSQELQYICELYRNDNRKSNLSFFERFFLTTVRGLMSISLRSVKYIELLYKKPLIERYHKALSRLIMKKKIPISLSGINVVSKSEGLYVTIGKYIPEGLNIMAPFNGEGDHLVFEVKNGVYFKPTIDETYNRLNGGHLNVIETLNGINYAWKWGIPVWIHLNSCRKNIWKLTQENIKRYPNSFIELKTFFESSYKELIKHTDKEIMDRKRKIMYHFVFSSITQSSINYIQKINDSLQKIFTTLPQ